MLSEVKIKVDEIIKVKSFDNAIVFYTSNNYYVCTKDQELPTKDDLFITLKLKGGSDEDGKK